MFEEILFRGLADARASGAPCVLATVVSVRGSAPRAPGAKALFFPDGRIVGTLGGGRFEALAASDGLGTLGERKPLLKSYPLHESDLASFGAICGGEVTILFEPQAPREALVVVGAGHCGRALCRLARECGWHVSAVDDREDLLTLCDAHVRHAGSAPSFIAGRTWRATDALVLVSRNFELDREALAAALASPPAGYVGMIGSVRKVDRVFADLRARGLAAELLASVRAPVGLDLGADAPAEIAVSILAEIMGILRQRSGKPLSERPAQVDPGL